MENGAVVGKFYPPHAGHHFLIETAREQVDDLTIIVVEHDGEKPTGEERERWLREAFPNDTVILVPDINDDDNSEAWAEYTIDVLGEVPQVVFTSEEYGEKWAKHMGSKHVLVDMPRETYRVSGTNVRSNPYENWQYLDKNVRAYYAKRVCVLGAESTGTTTLTEALARQYETTWVPEYGRTYTYGKVTANEEGSQWNTQDFVFIAEQQNLQEDQMAKYANKILFCDTNSFATAVWHERYMDGWSEEVAETFKGRKYDLYIVTDVDIPFVQDGIRDGEHIRKKMHKRFIELLEDYGQPYIIASGSVEERLALAVKHCNRLLG